jgi:GH15 family glucan-1,4-alpha-glucosidase
MARSVVLSNGSLAVGLDANGLVHDFYYPYVGLENLTTARSSEHKIGVWVDGDFSWVDKEWESNVNFEDNALIGNSVLINHALQIKIQIEDCVDHRYNALLRKFRIYNLSDTTRDIRLFLHQVFQISQEGRGDTALFVPDDNYILDYKGRCSLLIFGQSAHKPFESFAVGNYGIEGKEGTFRDAEDGELSGCAVEHAGVDSVIGFKKKIQPNHHNDIEYWIIAADSQQNAEKIHSSILKDSLDERISATRSHWTTWLSSANKQLSEIDPQHQTLVKKSLMIMKAHIDKRGGVIASCDSSIYNYGRDYYSYVWPRDGAYIMWPLIRMGYKDEPRKFFEFCRDILTPDGYLMHKYQPDRAIGSTWHPLLHGKSKELAIQEDETAIVIYMLGEYFRYTGDKDFIQSLYYSLVQPCANFITSFIDEHTGLPHASYDLWEEKFLTTTYTTAVCYQSLLVAAEFAKIFDQAEDEINWQNTAQRLAAQANVFFNEESNFYRKGFLLQANGSLLFDNTIDVSSFYGVFMYDFSDNPELSAKTLESAANVLTAKLLSETPGGGLPRYEFDNYFASNPQYKGNPWFVATLWLAQYYIRSSKLDAAQNLIEWCKKNALTSGVFSEQCNPSSGEPVGVTPLVWSHAEFVNTILDLSATHKK